MVAGRSIAASVAVALGFVVPSVQAQYDPIYYINLSDALVRAQQGDRVTQLNADLARDAVSRAVPPAGARAQASLIAPTEASGGVASRLAAAYPAASRAQAQKAFEELLAHYAGIEQQFGIAHGDIAGALAAFIAGNLMAYRNVEFPDEYFKPLVTQLSRGLAAGPAFASLAPAQRQESYEQLATIGMLMAATQMALKEHPSAAGAASMKAAARQYMAQVLKLDAEQVSIGPQGLVIAEHATSAQHDTRPIRQVVLWPQWNAGGIGGGMAMKYLPIVLYEDGSARRNLEASDVGANPRDLGRWQLDGKELRLRWNDGREDQGHQWSRCKPADATLQLNGVYESQSSAAGGPGAASVVAWHRYRFMPGGRYAVESGAGAATAGTAVSSRRAAVQGGYRLQGYGITLVPDGGAESSLLFCRFPDSDKALVLGGLTLLQS